jgi:single-strand DNA-binding protein
LNVWTITGFLGQDPRLRTLPGSGESVLNLSVAVQKRKKKDGQWVNDTLWVDVTLFGKRAEGVAPLLAKGSRIGASGELGVREYIDRNNQARFQLELVAREIDVLESRERRPDSERPAASSSAQRAAPPGGAPAHGTRPGTTGFGGTHRDDFAQGGRAQGSFGGGYAGSANGKGGGEYDYGAGDDDIPF